MKIVIYRTKIRPDYVIGGLYIDGLKVCDTLENPNACVPAGSYSISLIKCKQYARKMPILTPSYLNCANCKKLPTISNNSTLPCFCPMLKPGNGVHNRLDGSILVGECSVPGLIIHPKRHFDALFERLRKSLSRGNSVELIITEKL